MTGRCPICGQPYSYGTHSDCARRKREQEDAEKARREAQARAREEANARIDELNKLRKTDPARYAAIMKEKREERERQDAAVLRAIVTVAIAAVVIAGIVALFYFGKGLYMSLAPENAAMSVIRDENADTFTERGEAIAQDGAISKKEALEAFAKSGASYRMEGDFEYGYYSGGKTVELSTNVSMSYNAENDVYRFDLKSAGGDDKLNNTFRITDGTYYIVKENGTTYVLHELDGVKSAVGTDDAVYNFLMSYRMETVMSTSLIGWEGVTRFSLWDGDYYRVEYTNLTGMMVYQSPATELRVYKDKPVHYFHRYQNSETGIENNFILDYYYDKIPTDKPNIADYR